MDSITHILSGAVVSSLGIRQKLGKEGVVLFIIATSFADLDFVLNIIGKTVYVRFHRGFTHSLFWLPFLALLLAFIFHFFSRADFKLLYLISFSGMLMHIAFDVLNSYGTPILSPFTAKNFALDIDIILDLYFILPFLLGWMGAAICPCWQKKIAAIVIIFIAAGVLGRYIQKERAMLLLKERAPAAKLNVLPQSPDTIYNPFMWQGVERKEEGYSVYLINTLGNKIKSASDFAYRYEVLKKYIPESEYLRDFIRWSRFPYADIEYTGDKILINAGDLRFNTGGGRNYILKVVITNGKLLSENFSFRDKH